MWKTKSSDNSKFPNHNKQKKKKEKRKKGIPDQRKLFFHHLQHQAQPNAQTNGSALSLATTSPAQSATPPPSQKFDKQINKTLPPKLYSIIHIKVKTFLQNLHVFIQKHTKIYTERERGVKRGPVEGREDEGCAAD